MTDDDAALVAELRNMEVREPFAELRVVESDELTHLLDLADEAMRLRAENEKLRAVRDAAFRSGAMYKPPCFACGYNGEGYFCPASHPCAAEHHAAIDRAEGKS